MTSDHRVDFIEKLAAENREFYGTRDGRAALRAFELSFEHRWVYLFELVQNALDANARTIAIDVSEGGDGLVFQHDGGNPLDEEDVEALSKIFRSTKGASSVGFMGIGFKSVFGRFREARISGWGWKFRYEIEQFVGHEFGDVQPDLLGAVTPIWDETTPLPASEFTTRFEFRTLVGPKADLKSDLAKFAPDDDRTPLAILASTGLQRLELDGQVWELGIHEESDGSFEATALSDNENLLWQLFPVGYKPSRQAIARFLEHRRIQPTEGERERVYSEAAREREVLGVLPLGDDGVPTPPHRGRVYATVPTEITVPFGLHINADLLLNMPRTGLREIGENPWQREIVDQITTVVAKFLDWVSRTFQERLAAKAAYDALTLPSSEEGNRLEALLSEKRWLDRLHGQLEDAAIFPVWTEEADTLGFAKASEVLNPPTALADAFEDESSLQPAVLMQGPVLAREVLGAGARNLFRQAGLLDELSPRELEEIWSHGLEQWWDALNGDAQRRRDLLLRLWGAVAEFASSEGWQAVDLPCVRTASGAWLPVDEAIFFKQALPSEREPGGQETRELIESHLPDARSSVPGSWMGALHQAAAKEDGTGPLSRARKWVEARGRSIDLREAVEEAVDALESSEDPDWEVLVSLGMWVLHRQTRADLLTHVLVESNGRPMGVAIKKALLADPYVERGESRRRLFPQRPPISSAYLVRDPKGTDAHEWRGLFERAGAPGALRVRAVESHASRRDRDAVADFLGVDPDELGEANSKGYTLLDFKIEPGLPDSDAPEELRRALAPWLEDGFSALHGKGRRKVSYFYYRQYSDVGSRPSTWLRKLRDLRWIPCDDGKLRSPREALPRPDPSRAGMPVAQLSGDLLTVLEEEGIEFGAAIPEAPALRRLLALGSQLDADDLAELLHEIRDQTASQEDATRLKQVVSGLTVPSNDGRRVPLDRVVHRVGGRLRGALGGWIVSLKEIPQPLRGELIHADFPYEFPETTTGIQALGLLRHVWKRARSSPHGLANEVRDVLPAAYSYVLNVGPWSVRPCCCSRRTPSHQLVPINLETDRFDQKPAS